MPSPYLSNYGVYNWTAATLDVTAAAFAGNTIVSNLAATQTATLPAATGSGNIYRFFVNITKSGDLIIKVNASPGTDIMQGGVAVSTDAAGVAILASATADTITMNGGTKGGVKGSWVELQDVMPGVWRVGGFLVSTGNEATPFSAAVP